MRIHTKKTAVFAVCLLVYLMGVVVFALFSGNEEKKSIIADIDQHLLLAARGLKYMLAPDFHDRATSADAIALEEILQNQQIISSYAADSGFTYLYTVVRQGDLFFFAAPTVTQAEYKERQNWYYYPYADIPEEFVGAFDTLTSAYVSYDDQWGAFRSVALPQKTPGGRTYLACADMDISFVNALVGKVYLRMFLYSGYFLLLTLPFSLTYLHFNRRLSRTNNKLAHHQEHLEALVATRTAELEKQKCRAETSDRLKTVFMANISHEIRTPLNSIVGFAELIQNNFDPDESVKHAGFILKSGEHLSKLVDQLLDHTRITSGQVKMMARPFDLMVFLDSLVQSEIITARKKGLKLLYTIDTRLPRWVDGDPFHLRQVLLNLINNAFKFTPKGCIYLDVTCEAGKQDTVWVSFSVKDSGIGIPPEKLDVIFSPFVQADNGTSRIFGGTGLGITIARQLVILMGGRIQVENNEDMGCRFWFDIPFKKSCVPMVEDVPDTSSSLKTMPALQPKGSILVVDDYASNLTLARRQLESAGHGVVTVDTGIKAIECCDHQTFDLILMDINMAGMDGYQTTKILKDPKGRNSGVPVIALTASADNHTMEKCRNTGMVDLITKPVNRMTLLKIVDKWLNHSSDHLLSSPEQEPPAEEHIPVSFFDTMADTVSIPICREQALKEFDGDRVLLDTVIQQFMDQLERQIDTIEGAMDHKNFGIIYSQSHAIKGGAGNLRALPLAEAAGALEKRSAEKDHRKCKLAFQCLCKEARRLKLYLYQREGHIENSDC